MNHRGLDLRKVSRQHRAALHFERFNRSLATDSATRAGIKMALYPCEIDLHAGLEFYCDRVAGLPGISLALGPVNAPDLARVLENSFGKKKAGGQFEVM